MSTVSLSPWGRHELRLAVPDGGPVVLHPDPEEPDHTLNVKRGIISALLVPLETEDAQRLLFLVRIWKADGTALRARI